MAVRLAADLRPSTDESAVRTPLVAKLQCADANSQCAIAHVWPYGTFVALANLRYINALNKNNNNDIV